MQVQVLDYEALPEEFFGGASLQLLSFQNFNPIQCCIPVMDDACCTEWVVRLP